MTRPPDNFWLYWSDFDVIYSLKWPAQPKVFILYDDFERYGRLKFLNLFLQKFEIDTLGPGSYFKL